MEETVVKRVMPHNNEAERSVIACMLMSREAILAASEILTKEDFYQSQYGIMFETIVGLYQENRPVDLVTVQAALREKDVPPQISDLDFIRDLYESEPSSANVGDYAEIVHNESMMRRLIRLNEDIMNTCYAGKEKTEDILEYTEKSVFELLKNRGTPDFIPVKDIALKTLDRIEAASKMKTSVTGIPTGFMDLDYRLSGLQPSDLILLAARPSMGKTAFVLNVAENICFKQKKHVAIFSLEMSSEQLMNRLFAMESHIDSQKLRNGYLSDNEWSRLVASVGRIGNSNLILDDTPGITFPELRSRCRRYQVEYGLDVVIIDYLQLMTSAHRIENRQQEVSEMSRSLKSLARELQVPVIACSQVSRACEARPDHRPMLSDLRESGAIEQDADVVMFLYRDDYYNKDSEEKNMAEVIIAKQRNGPTGTINLQWVPEYTKFNSVIRDDKDQT